MNEVILPWPPKLLNPNDRSYWRAKAKAAKAYRAECAWLCKQAKLKAPDTTGKIVLWLDFYPPDKRARDDDNVFASFKAGRDGIADALGIDDKRFRCMPYLQTKTGGFVNVRLTQLPVVWSEV